MSWDDLTKKVEFLFLREIGVLDFEIESLISLELKKEKKIRKRSKYTQIIGNGDINKREIQNSSLNICKMLKRLCNRLELSNIDTIIRR